jgi:myo-inositol 2-dehydrogenase/D-chiro-inositol 1-dehydrogenase
MGSGYLKALRADDRWDVVSVCDLNEERLDWATELIPDVETSQETRDITSHADIDVVGIFTLADIRPQLLDESLKQGKHVMAEKPLAASVGAEKELLRTIEASDRIVAVNLFNRNAWYHEQIQSFIRQDQIGQLAAVTISHQTPGVMPTERHQPEGPPFHNCGMHYVDVARWYAGSEYDRWHAQGLRMWSWDDPWWINAHGHFKNGVVFSITQGFAYGQLAETKVNRCGLDAIGTKGVVRMQHDFHTVRIEFHGVSRTEVKEGPYGGKKLDVMCERFAQALDSGDTGLLPTARDSVIASEISQAMLDAASSSAAPGVGTPEEMAEILTHRGSSTR